MKILKSPMLKSHKQRQITFDDSVVFISEPSNAGIGNLISVVISSSCSGRARGLVASYLATGSSGRGSWSLRFESL